MPKHASRVEACFWGDDASRGTCGFAIARPSPRMDAWNSRTTTTSSPSQPWFRRVDGFSFKTRVRGLEASSYPVEDHRPRRGSSCSLPTTSSPHQAAVRHAEGALGVLRRQVRGHRPLRCANPGGLREASVLREGRPAQRLSAGLAGRARREIVRIHSSSGTTGTPVIIPYTQQDVTDWAIQFARCYETAGITNRDRIHITPATACGRRASASSWAPSAWAP